MGKKGILHSCAKDVMLCSALKGGPLTGKGLADATALGMFELWRACRSLDGIVVKLVGKRYLRLDKNVEGFARLSPSIQRELSTYSVIGLKKDSREIIRKAARLESEIKKISMRKLEAAKAAVLHVLARVPSRAYVEQNACFIIGGDVAIGMAHGEPRPVACTGEMVDGSDLDIVVITKDSFPKELLKGLDEAMYEIKYQMLRGVGKKEEMDYVIKSLSKVRRQARFKTFKHMIACKIICESRLLAGSAELYKDVLGIMKKSRVDEKIKELVRTAAAKRKKAEKSLLEKGADSGYMGLFSTAEEFGEIF